MRLKIIKGKNKVNQEITKYTAKKKKLKVVLQEEPKTMITVLICKNHQMKPSTEKPVSVPSNVRQDKKTLEGRGLSVV